jgi:hypothetical protein
MYEVQQGFLRMINFKGYWLLEQQGNMLKITHQMHGDPGGNLPSWFINSTITRAPYYTFLALKNRAQ